MLLLFPYSIEKLILKSKVELPWVTFYTNEDFFSKFIDKYKIMGNLSVFTIEFVNKNVN